MATGDLLLFFTPLHAETPASNYATFDFRNRHPVLDFDGSTNESIIFTGIMPANYGGGGVDVVVFWSSDGTTGDHDWRIQWERIYNWDGPSGIDIDSDNWSSGVDETNNPVPGTSGVIDYSDLVCTDGAQMGNVDALDLFRIMITRLASADTSTVDANVIAVAVIEE